MSDWPLSDPMGTILYELRAANVASKRVRSDEPAPGDAKGPKQYQRFVVVVDLGGPPLHRAPLQTLRYVIRCYGATFQDARALFSQCHNVLDNAGPRYGPTDVALHQTLDESGGSSGSDPITNQPFYEGTFVVMAGAEALAS